MKADKETKLRRVRIFQAAQPYFAILGFDSALANQQYAFNWRIFFGFLLSGVATILFLMFIIIEAKTFWEFSQTIYFYFVMFIEFITLIVLVFQAQKIFNFIANFENVINTSE